MIAIKDMEMEMPKNCSECNMTTCKGKDEPWNYACSINLKDIDFNETKRPKYCPLVEIVTCKDCIHWDKYSVTRDPLYHYCNMDDFNTKEDYFCALGKRKE